MSYILYVLYNKKRHNHSDCEGTRGFFVEKWIQSVYWSGVSYAGSSIDRDSFNNMKNWKTGHSETINENIQENRLRSIYRLSVPLVPDSSAVDRLRWRHRASDVVHRSCRSVVGACSPCSAAVVATNRRVHRRRPSCNTEHVSTTTGRGTLDGGHIEHSHQDGQFSNRIWHFPSQIGHFSNIIYLFIYL